jgi:hypothetical protein
LIVFSALAAHSALHLHLICIPFVPDLHTIRT